MVFGSIRGGGGTIDVRDNAKLQALAKQLSQLDSAGSKIGETCRCVTGSGWVVDAGLTNAQQICKVGREIIGVQGNA